MNKRTIHIEPLKSVNGLAFGSDLQTIKAHLGQPDEALENYTGELELLYQDSFYRYFDNRLVECTFPEHHQFVINGTVVLSVFDWLLAREDVLDRARFRISASCGIAFDYRISGQCSITVFEQGRWDYILGQ